MLKKIKNVSKCVVIYTRISEVVNTAIVGEVSITSSKSLSV